MTKVAFLLDLSSCPLVVFCCILSCANQQPASFKRRRTQSRLCVRVSVTETREDSVGFISAILFLMNYMSTHVSAPADANSVCAHVCVLEQCMASHTVAVKNHKSMPSSSPALFVVRGDCVLPRLLVGERLLHSSLTGFHSN